MKQDTPGAPEMVAVSQKTECWRFAGGHFSPVKTNVVLEKEFTIEIDGRFLAMASLSPGMEREFTVGYLAGQGFIRSIEDIKSLEITAKGAKIITRNAHDRIGYGNHVEYRIVSGGGSGAFAPWARIPNNIHSGLQIRHQDIHLAMNTLFEKASLYKETEGVHTSGLFDAGAHPLCITQDIGRHNTLDKAIGYAILNNIDCRKTFLATTGRLSSEMVIKSCRAGIPLVASKTAVTAEAYKMAKGCGLTIIGFIRTTGMVIHTDMTVRTFTRPEMKIYTHAGRVI